MKRRRYLNKIKYELQNIFKSRKRIIILIITLILTLIVLAVIFYIWQSSLYSDKKYKSVEEIETKKVAIVFGAGLWSGKPSPILRDRVQASVDLYKAGKVERIIMSGDNRFEDYDEPSAMINMALEEGVPEAVLQPDYAGRRTYDTCLRAKKIFKLDEAILVTQNFHMNRALYTCNSLGIDSIGFLADYSDYGNEFSYKSRDYFAFMKAIWDVEVSRPDDVVLGDVIEI